MTRRVVFHPAARRDLLNSALYLEKHNPGSGYAFVEALQQALEEIVGFPLAAPISIGGTRKKVLVRFKHTMYFRVTDAEIRVLAVAHHRREPGYWTQRDPDYK